jgi:hypothetical protein
MSQVDWLELVQLAEALCPAVLLDLPLLLEGDAHGVLVWLRAKAKEAM